MKPIFGKKRRAAWEQARKEEEERKEQERRAEEERKERERKVKAEKEEKQYWLLCSLGILIYAGIMIAAFGFNLSFILFAAAAAVALPIKAADRFWESRFHNKKVAKGVAIALLVVAAMAFSTGLRESIARESASAPQSTVSSSVSEAESSQVESSSAPMSTATPEPTATPSPTPAAPVVTLSSIPAYDESSPYVAINGNVPYFADSELTTTAFENYSSLDSQGRCGVAYANICQELMPTEERGEIGMIKPSGWQIAKYDSVDGKYLYNRCHLIGFQLAGENANEKNLITGTRYMNVQGMLPFENLVADYVKETNNHVLYRVTPMFDGSNPLASGVLMEAKSVEDKGAGVLFCVFCYNVQPGIVIDYTTGDSHEEAPAATPEPTQAPAAQQGGDTGSGNGGTGGTGGGGGDAHTYILNTHTHKFHLPGCPSADDIKPSNRQEVNESRDALIAQGYNPCKRCNP